jgi:hypothetical protein
MKISAGHFVGAREPPHCAVLVSRITIAIVTPHELASVTLYSITQFPRADYDMPRMLSRWSDGTICLADQEES